MQPGFVQSVAVPSVGQVPCVHQGEGVGVRMCLHVCACVRACVRACVCACVCVCVCAYVCMIK